MTIEFISSPSNPRIKAAASLRDAKHRRLSRRLLIDGEDLLTHALLGGIPIVEIFVQHTDSRTDQASTAAWSSRIPSARVQVVAPEAMHKLQYGERDLPVIGVAEQPDTSLAALNTRLFPKHDPEMTSNKAELSLADGIYLVLDRMEKPGNLGAVLRSADAAGVRAVLLSDAICDAWNPNAIRSSLGAIFRIPIAVASETEIHGWLLEHAISVFTARVEGSREYTSIEYPNAVAIVIGNEAHGLESRWIRPDATAIRIPMLGAMDSLNASVSTSVILFEVVRQFAGKPRQA